MSLAKLRDLLRAWSVALALSATLVAAGEHWPGPLPIRPALVWGLVLLPPLAVAALLLLRWPLPDGPLPDGPSAAAEARESGN